LSGERCGLIGRQLTAGGVAAPTNEASAGLLANVVLSYVGVTKAV
jgi:hypothetical protein